MYGVLKNDGASYDVIIPSDYMISRMIEEGVVGVPQVLEGDAHAVAGVVEHQNLLGIRRVEEQAPAVGGALHHGGIVNDPQHPPHIGDAIQIVRVVSGRALVIA